MSKLFSRSRRTRDINGIVPVIGVLVAVGLMSGISELGYRAADAQTVARASSTEPARARQIRPVSFINEAAASSQSNRCDHATESPPHNNMQHTAERADHERI